MKHVKTILIILAIVILGIVWAGIYKFNYLANQAGYDVDGNKKENIKKENIKNEEIKREVIDIEEIIVSEFPAESEDECSYLEDFDAERQVCYFECSNEQECEEIEMEIEKEFEDLYEEYDDFSKNNFEEKHHFDNEGIEVKEENILAKYKLEKWEKFVLLQWKETPKNAKVIDWIKNISPDSFSDTYIKDVTLASTLGDGGTLAYVIQDSDDATRWNIVVAMESFSLWEKEVVFTLIHEFSHILTLNKAQMQELGEECTTLDLNEWCLNKKSYLNSFYDTFWKGKFSINDESDEDIAEKNYTKNPEAFVSPYAATNPTEDIAESFANFVFNKEPQNTQHIKNQIKNQKIAFFYTYPELVKIRNDIRKNLMNFVRKRIK